MRLLTPTLFLSAVVLSGTAASLGSQAPIDSPLTKDSDSSTPIYKDASKSVDERLDDLLSRMTLEEKVGQMFQQSLAVGENYTLYPGDETHNGTYNFISEKLMTHFNLLDVVEDPKKFAEWHNRVQELAQKTRLGIPVTLTTGPRHHPVEGRGSTIAPGAFSMWPDTLGLAAIRDMNLIRKFGDVAREEYRAVGIRVALHPQVDLMTEPRWGRAFGTWSEDANLTSAIVTEFVKGFQGDKVGPTSVTTVTKHFPGGGPVAHGEDTHFAHAKNASYPGHNFDYHLIPFKAAIAAGTTQMMAYYSRPIGTKYEEVGFGFNRGIITELLRKELAFEGIIMTDWGLVTDDKFGGLDLPARAWGMESFNEVERIHKILDAGVDQISGEHRTELVLQLVHEGLVPEERLDPSVRRLMKEKFLLGLFDNPFVDPDNAVTAVGKPEYIRLGEEAQRRSYTLLSNKKNFLPLQAKDGKLKVYPENINTTAVQDSRITWVKTPEEADVAFLRLWAPFDPRNGTLEEAFGFRTGTLEYTDEEKHRQAAIYATVPTVAAVFLDRPIAILEVIEQATAVLGEFGTSDEAFLDVVFGTMAPEGKLPFDMPRSNAAVEVQFEDVPFDTVDPVFKFGHGLSYATK